MRKALEPDPVSPVFLADLGQLHYFSGEYELAEKYCRQAQEVDPNFALAHEYLYYVYVKTGQDEKAIIEIAKVDQINSSFAHDGSKTFDPLGRYGEAFRASGLRGYLELRYPGDAAAPSSFYHYAIKHSLAGDSEKALECLEKSIEDRQFLTVFQKPIPFSKGSTLIPGIKRSFKSWASLK